VVIISLEFAQSPTTQGTEPEQTDVPPISTQMSLGLSDGLRTTRVPDQEEALFSVEEPKEEDQRARSGR